MIKLKLLLNESIDDPYRFRNTFKHEMMDVDDEETGETYQKEVLSPVQLVKFKTDEGVEYLWYARQNRMNDKFWEIAFGVYQGIGYNGSHKLDISLIKNSKNPFRVFATVIDIINTFIEFDEDRDQIEYLMFDSKGDKRTKLYLNRLLPRIDHFEVDHITNDGRGNSNVTLKRVS